MNDTNTKNIPAIDRVFEALVVNGEQLTAKQIANRYNVANPYDTVYTLRQEGYAIYLDQRTNSKGRTTNKYRHGAPTRQLVAAGYRAMASGLVE